MKESAPKISEKKEIQEEINRISNIPKGIYDIEDVKKIRCDNLISLMKPTK